MTPTTPIPEPSAELPLSVWPTAQTPSRWQRQGRYLAASLAHPAKMLPAIARTAISAYTAPGELVCDPLCGIGTTLVEAVHSGRRAFGVELEPQWAGLADANLTLATAAGAPGSAEVICGDARDLVHLLPGELHGQVALVLTSPPYTHAAYNHGQVRTRPGQGVEKWHNRYSANPDNLGNTNPARLLAGVEQILAGCRLVLRPGGLVVLTTRPWRWHGALVDLPGQVARAAERAGLVPLAGVVLPDRQHPQVPRRWPTAPCCRARGCAGVSERGVTNGPEATYPSGSPPGDRGRSIQGVPPKAIQAEGELDGVAPQSPDCSSNVQNGQFDRPGEVLAPSTQGRRGPLTLTLEITWVDAPAANALRRTQARVLRDLLAALTPGPNTGHHHKDE